MSNDAAELENIMGRRESENQMGIPERQLKHQEKRLFKVIRISDSQVLASVLRMQP
jgi:hypothetical protein